MMDDLERQLIEAGRQEPGANLRARVLAASIPLIQPDDRWIDRAWFAIRWRTAAALLLLVVGAGEALAPWAADPAVVAQDRRAPNVVKTTELAALDLGLTPAQAADVGAQARAASRQWAAIPLNAF